MGWCMLKAKHPGRHKKNYFPLFSYATRLDGRERETALHCAIRWEKQSVVDMFNGKDSGEVFKGEVCKLRRNQAHIVR